MPIMRMGYVHARVTDLQEAKHHYGYTMGLYETRSEPGRVFYKGWDEWDHHSVVLEEGGVGLAKIGHKVSDPGDIEIYEKRAEQSAARSSGWPPVRTPRSATVFGSPRPPSTSSSSTTT
jgi:catechol 2,3-dioxygenase